jgi:hypothetical protein
MLVQSLTEGVMAKLVASTFIGSGSLWLFLDDKLIIQNSEKQTIELNRGEEYIVHWFVKGTPGSSFSITISSPREAEFQLTRVIVVSGKDCGEFRFKN